MKSIFTLVTFLVLCCTLSAQKPNISEESPAAAAGGSLLTRTTPRVTPIALPKDENHLYSSFLSRQTKWIEELLLADFRKRNVAASWRKDAVEVLLEAAPYLSSEIGEELFTSTKLFPSDSLIKKAKAVTSAGCDDPLFNFVTAYLICFQRTRTEEAASLAERRYKDLLAGNDSPHLKLLAGSWVWGVRNDQNAPSKNESKAKEWEKEMPRLLLDALDASQTPAESLAFYMYAKPGKIAFVFNYLRRRQEGLPILKTSWRGSVLAP